MDRKLWKSNIIDGKPCPRCEKGGLIPNKAKKAIVAETAESKSELVSRSLVGEFIFSVLYTCSYCEEPFLVTGDRNKKPQFDVKVGKYKPVYENTLSYIHPPLHIIDVPETTPETAAFLIADSFGLFWLNKNACANKLRGALEALMDDYNAKGVDTEARTLHHRIEKLCGHFPQLLDKLMAVKWIGNAGSHNGGEDLTEDDVLDAYELLELILHEDRISNLARNINSNKGPINWANILLRE